jgi:TolC family type I secretion outer membrane protein
MVKAFQIASLKGAGRVVVALSLIGAPACAQTMTLADAVAAAYRTNPTLQLQRSQLRQLDEGYVQAFAAYRPTVSLSAQTQYTYQQQPSEFTGSIIGVNSNTLTMGVSATQILYNGGRTAASVSTAEANILAAREQLRQQEADTISSVIQAYAAVLRDTAILAAQREAVDAYIAQANEIEARFKEGDVTRTDLEQAQSQLATGRSSAAIASGALEGSRAAYVAVVGENPGDLAPLPPLKGIPAVIDQAFDMATSDSPALLQAILTERASAEQIREQRAQSMPTVTAQAFYGYEGTALPYSSRTTYRDASGTVTFNLPLFTGGLNASKTRQSREQYIGSRLQTEVTRRNVIQAVAQNWNNLVAAERSLAADRNALTSARESSHGMQVEYKAGLRSTLEVLNEEQRLQVAEVAVATDEYNHYVAQTNLLDAIGRLQTTDLTTGVPLYDPAEHFRRVKDVGATPLDVPIATLDHVGEPGSGPLPVTPTPPAAEAPHDVIQTAPPSSPRPFSDTSPGDPSLAPAPTTLSSAIVGRDLWMVVPDAPTFRVASDARSIACDGDICSAWELTRYTAVQPDGTLLLVDRAEYDCQKQQTRTLEETRYAADGVGRSVALGASPWQTIKPNTAAESSAAFACAIGHPPAPSLAERSLSLDGRTYPELSSADTDRFIGAAPAVAAKPALKVAHMVVQVAATATQNEADAALESVRRQSPALVAGLQTRVEPATVSGRVVYRAVLDGFQDDREAKAACDELHGVGVACFVRRRQ